jgi:hypothetical protein
MTSFGAFYITRTGASWELRARTADLNRDATTEEPNHTVAPLATTLDSIDFVHRRDFLGGRLAVGAGFERRQTESLSSSEDKWRLTAEWIRDL